MEEIRKYFKPRPKQELDEHAMRYERLKQVKTEEQRRLREESVQAQKDHLERLKQHVKINLEPPDSKLLAEEDRKLQEEKRKLLEKVRSYAKNVKEMYWPKISEEKRQEIQYIKE